MNSARVFLLGIGMRGRRKDLWQNGDKMPVFRKSSDSLDGGSETLVSIGRSHGAA